MRYIKHGLLQIGLLLLLISNVYAVNLQPLSQRQAQLVLPETSITTMQMPALDNAALVQRDLTNPTPARRFAEMRSTLITPKTHGKWETVTTADGEKRIWRMTVQSPGAVSLNLTFAKYFMPEGTELFIYAPGHKQILGPYTQNDATVKQQLWTPIIQGDTILIEVNVPSAKEKELVLDLSFINHGYQAAIAKSTGSCNIDVACPAGDAWRDQIRSSVSYTYADNPQAQFPNFFVCSGSLINNTAQDNTQYLLTANHCGVTAANSDSVVVYFNYQNSKCRPLNSNANSNPGDGIRDQSVVSGASFVSSYEATDFNLLKIIKPIPASFNVFYAGWDRSQINKPTSVAGIHHPNGEEKRISLVTDPALLSFDTNGVTGSVQLNQSHIRIVWWNAGTTEGGSSGSALFNQNKRIVGQLSGGDAACSSNPTRLNNGLSDWYGRFKLSWDGNINDPNTNASSRLSDWLDPNNTGLTFIDGKNANSTNTAQNVLQNSIPVVVSSTTAQTSKDYTITIPANASNLRLSTTGSIPDADLYAKFGSAPTLTLFDARSWSSSSNENITISSPQAGIYHIKVYSYSVYTSVTLKATYDTISVGTILKTFTNESNVKIINEATTNSTITSNYNNIAGTLSVDIDIKHTDIRDLSINLIAPNNQSFRIDTLGMSTNQNINTTKTFNIPAGISNGIWRLDVKDNAKLDTGFIDSWKITLP